MPLLALSLDGPQTIGLQLRFALQSVKGCPRLAVEHLRSSSTFARAAGQFFLQPVGGRQASLSSASVNCRSARAGSSRSASKPPSGFLQCAFTLQFFADFAFVRRQVLARSLNRRCCRRARPGVVPFRCNRGLSSVAARLVERFARSARLSVLPQRFPACSSPSRLRSASRLAAAVGASAAAEYPSQRHRSPSCETSRCPGQARLQPRTVALGHHATSCKPPLQALAGAFTNLDKRARCRPAGEHIINWRQRFPVHRCSLVGRRIDIITKRRTKRDFITRINLHCIDQRRPQIIVRHLQQFGECAHFRGQVLRLAPAFRHRPAVRDVSASRNSPHPRLRHHAVAASAAAAAAATAHLQRTWTVRLRCPPPVSSAIACSLRPFSDLGLKRCSRCFCSLAAFVSALRLARKFGQFGIGLVGCLLRLCKLVGRRLHRFAGSRPLSASSPAAFNVSCSASSRVTASPVSPSMSCSRLRSAWVCSSAPAVLAPCRGLRFFFLVESFALQSVALQPRLNALHPARAISAAVQ